MPAVTIRICPSNPTLRAVSTNSIARLVPRSTFSSTMVTPRFRSGMASEEEEHWPAILKAHHPLAGLYHHGNLKLAYGGLLDRAVAVLYQIEKCLQETSRSGDDRRKLWWQTPMNDPLDFAPRRFDDDAETIQYFLQRDL